FYRGRFQDDGTFAWTGQHLFKPSRPDLDLLRSPSIVAAKDGSGKVWVAFSTLRGACGRRGTAPGEIAVYRSTDEGKTWEEPVTVSPEDSVEPADNKDPRCGTGVIQILPSMAVGPKGELYVTWQFGPTLLTYNPFTLAMRTVVKVARSLDGGHTFNTPVPVALVHSMRQNPPVAYSKNTMNDIPRLAVAASGPYAGRVYLTYTSAVREAPSFDNVQSLTSSQVYLAYSDDQGVTWSQPVPLGPPLPPDGVKRLWPAVAVRANGAVDAVYLESQEKQVTPDPKDVECEIGMVNQVARAGAASSLIDVYWVQSTDGGASFSPPLRVTSETSNWCKVGFDFQTTQYANFGDLLGIDTAGDRAFVVWPDGRSGVPDAYFAELRGGGAPAPRPEKPAQGH
ncbi:MAG TPA: sialidase family protein, partial [Thermoanaerobaculia bacterium]|nr:sialidase family protein [Thermoanaerobaculia bacterium]